MNKRRSGIILIALGLVAALVVGFMVFRITQNASAEKIVTVDVVVALQDIPERTVLSQALVGVHAALPDGLPPGVASKPEQVVGKMNTNRLFAGEMILAGRLVDSNGRSGVAYSLEKGRVLMTLPASDIIGLGAVRPGDHVDLLATITPPEKMDQATGAQSAPQQPDPDALGITVQTSQTTMQNLVIVGIGQLNTQVGTDAAPAAAAANSQTSMLTFAVNHDDALRLKMLKDSTFVKLELVLRAAGDEEVVQTEPVNLRSLLELYRVKK